MGPLHPSLIPPPSLLVMPLSPSSAHLLSFLFASGYVGSIYLSNHLRAIPATNGRKTPAIKNPSTGSSSSISLPPVEGVTTNDISSQADDVDEVADAYDLDKPKPGDRDHPDTIRRRMKAVGVATALSIGGVWLVVKSTGGYTASQAIRPTLALLGLNLTPSLFLPPLTSIPDFILPYVLAPTLLLGPLYATYLDGDLPSVSYSPTTGLKVSWDTFGVQGSGNWGLVEWRNYIVGPVTEEIVFRSCLLSIALLSKQSMKTMIFATPLWFGIAHAHHAWETFKKGGRTKQAAIRAIAGSVFQLTYTTLFGWFATYSYLRTGSVIPALISHAYCNMMGIYMPTLAIKRHPAKKGLIWGMYGLGVVGFVLGLRRL